MEYTERNQYIINSSKEEERKKLHDILIANGYKMIYNKNWKKSKFPFVIIKDLKYFYICESITSCAAAANQNVIKTYDYFKDDLECYL